MGILLDSMNMRQCDQREVVQETSLSLSAYSRKTVRVPYITEAVWDKGRGRLQRKLVFTGYLEKGVTMGIRAVIQ